MKRAPRLGTLLLIAACLILLTPLPASGVTIHRHVEKTIYRPAPDGRIPLDTIHFVKVLDLPPPDSDLDGVADKVDACPGELGQVSLDGCKPDPIATPATGSVASGPVPSYGGASDGCVGMEAESGSLGYASPGGGCYQIQPGTAANYGCDLSTPGGQDSCAADICAHQGTAAWTNPAGENPCGRL